MTALITGVTGQDGIYLARALRQLGQPVVGTALAQTDARRATYLPGIDVLDWDVRDAERLPHLLTSVHPTRIYHLAGFSSIGESWHQPELVSEVNDVAVQRLLAAVAAHAPAARVFVASSAAVAHDDSPYSLGKRAAEDHVRDARDAGLFACSARLHNHESPLRELRFVTRKIARAAAEIATGRRDCISLGTLGIRRDWGHARDLVEAMRLMLELDSPTDLELGTGVAHSLMELLEVAFGAAGLGDPSPYLHQDPELVRPTDAAEQVADTGPARRLLGWQAATRFEETIAHLVRADLARLESGIEDSADYL